MRIIRPHDDSDDEDRGRQQPAPIEPAVAGQVFADEVEDFLTAVAAEDPHKEVEEFLARIGETTTKPTPAPGSRPAPQAAAPATQPALTVVADGTERAVRQPDSVGRPVRTRGRAVRRTAATSVVVVASSTAIAWGEGPLVVGPLAVYATGWVAYLCWNAAHRPALPYAIGTVTAGIGHAVAAIATAIVSLLRAVFARIERARTAHEAHGTATSKG
ncbi:hypothetical protein ACWDYH_15225 [Nocardia goodfellowii]